MKLKLIILSPLTAMYNFQLKYETLSMKLELKRVVKIQLTYILLILLLGVQLVMLLSVGNLVYVMYLMYLKDNLNKDEVSKIYDKTVKNILDKYKK